MTNSKRFLEVLECPGDAAGDGDGRNWPLGVPAEIEPQPEHPLDHQCLSAHAIGGYLAGLRARDGGNGKASDSSSSIDFAALDRAWTAEKHPLVLCEFLAYKAGLAYRSPAKIRSDLLGLDAKGRRYKEGIDQYAFFDTASPGWSFKYPDTQAFVFTHRCTGYIILRESSSFSDWNTNLFSDLTTDTYPHLDTKPQIQVGSARPARHTGFAIAWGSIAPPLEAWVRDQLRHGRMDKIVLSGHSLGGALAVLGAHHFARHDICPVHAVVTFGAPKVGGLDFKSEYEHPRLGLKDRTLHIESAEDIVAIVSNRSDDQHVGHAWTFKKRPLRPSWQMMLLATMVDAEQATKKKVQRIEKKQQANAAQAKRPSPTGTSNSRQVQERTWTLLFLGLAFKALSFVTKLFARMLAAHSVEHRYGLFISTLSYQHIRRYHEELAALKCRQSGNQENKRIAVESAYAAANTDLAHHLKVSRGRNPRTFRHLANRPIRIETPSKLAEYKNKYTNYIA